MAGTLKVGTITTPSGSGSITIPSGVTLSGGGLANTPAFMAYQNAQVTGFSDATWSLMNFNTEEFDSDSAYDNTSGNFKFTVPSGQAGKYKFSTTIKIGDDSPSNETGVRWYKNGSELPSSAGSTYFNPYTGSYIVYADTCVSSIILDLSVGDYIQVYGRFNTSDNSTWYQNEGSSFSGFKLIGA